jgi:hypothetical protein
VLLKALQFLPDKYRSARDLDPTSIVFNAST